MIFPSANNLRNYSRNNLVIFDEARNIEREAIIASDNGMYSVEVTDTLMSDTNIDTWKTFHESVQVTGTVSVADPDVSAFVSAGDDIVIDSTTITFSGTTMQSVVDDINAALTETQASVHTDSGNYLRLTKPSGDTLTIEEGTADTALTDIGITADTYGTLNLDTNEITVTNHGLTTGDQIHFTTEGILPSPLTANLDDTYYAIVQNSNTIQIADSEANATNTIALDLTSFGTGEHSVRKLNLAQVYYQVWKGDITDRVKTDQMKTIIDYFERNKYTIERITNSNNVTFKWSIAW